jgi:hypothetical protein
MRDIDKLLQEIIPPNDYQHRNGFSNEHIIVSLSESEKKEIEHRLIFMLEKNDDILIGETLTVLKSIDSLPILTRKLKSANSAGLKIIWSSYINDIKNGDDEMKNIALKEFNSVSEKYSLMLIFHYLSRFNDPRIKEKVRSFINHKDYLIAYNARTSLGIDTKDLIEREQLKNKKKWRLFRKK